MSVSALTSCAFCYHLQSMHLPVLLLLFTSPFPQRVHEDDNKYPVEKCNALPVLKKAKFKGYIQVPK